MNVKHMTKIAGALFLSVVLLACTAADNDFSNKGGNNNNNNNNNNGGGNETPTVPDKVPAFPGAEGGGMYTTGGRGGYVICVTNLNDAGEGSLRWALAQNGKRTVVFSVSGTIALSSNIKIANGDVTVAGQTAPGDGICLKNYTLQVAANNVIIRFMRFRPGDYVVGINSAAEPDAIEGQNQKNVIIDHCSMSWSIDELSSWYANENFTLQWSMLYQSLRDSGHSKGAHGYTGLWGGSLASFHHNLVAHSDSRNPRIAHPLIEEGKFPAFVPGAIDVRNNVFYNWGSNSGYGGEGRKVNFVGNYYKPGQSTSTNAMRKTQIFEPYWTSEDAYPQNSSSYSYLVQPLGTFYLEGNVMTSSADVTADNWKGIAPTKDGAGGSYRKNSEELITAVTASAAQLAAMKLAAPHEMTGTTVTTHSAANAYTFVLAYAGASQWRSGAVWRDSADAAVVESVRNGTGGLVNTPADAGGYPTLTNNGAAAPVDTDGDGMPDAWETAKGLNPNDRSDGPLYTLDPASGYTNLEIYLNSLVKDITDRQNQ